MFMCVREPVRTLSFKSRRYPSNYTTTTTTTTWQRISKLVFAVLVGSHAHSHIPFFSWDSAERGVYSLFQENVSCCHLQSVGGGPKACKNTSQVPKRGERVWVCTCVYGEFFLLWLDTVTSNFYQRQWHYSERWKPLERTSDSLYRGYCLH